MACALQQQKPPQREDPTPQQRPVQPKIKINKKFLKDKVGKVTGSQSEGNTPIKGTMLHDILEELGGVGGQSTESVDKKEPGRQNLVSHDQGVASL